MTALRRSLVFCRDLPVPQFFRRQGYSTLFKDVRSDSTFHIPIINFSAFRCATSSHSEKRCVADEIVNGFKEVGFVYLTGHGIPRDAINEVFEKSATFFSLPQGIKDQVAWEDPRANRGYVQVGRERVTQSSDPAEIAALRAKAPDMKESMQMGRDWDPVWKNKWPKEVHAPGFRPTMLHFFKICHVLHVDLMRSIALGLDLDESFFDRRINQQYHSLRLLSYPSIPAKLLSQEGQARADAHSDYGSLSMLFQDSVGGLEVQNPHTQHFQPALPIPGTIIVNVGDLLARWSNDVLRSTLHRVVAPPAQKNSDTDGMIPTRRSIAFFCRPNFDVVVETLPTCVSATNPSKYEPVIAEEHIVGRLTATHY